MRLAPTSPGNGRSCVIGRKTWLIPDCDWPEGRPASQVPSGRSEDMGPTWGGGGPAARRTAHVPRGPTHGEDGPRKRELAKPPRRESAVLDPSGHGANRIRSRNGLRRALRPAGHRAASATSRQTRHSTHFPRVSSWSRGSAKRNRPRRRLSHGRQVLRRPEHYPPPTPGFTLRAVTPPGTQAADEKRHLCEAPPREHGR